MIEEVKVILLQFLTIGQWKTLVFLIVISSAVTETAKRVFFLRMSKLRKRQWVYGTAFITGGIAAYIGFHSAGVKSVPVHYWVMFGVLAGPASNLLHWSTLGLIAWKFPALAAALKGKS